MGSLKQHVFRRPRFNPLGDESKNSAEHDNIRSLPDLINFNAEANPDHVFCIQAEAEKIGDTPRAVRLSFKKLKHAIDACSSWLRKSFVGPEEIGFMAGGTKQKPRPVALYLESDVGLFIYIAALLASDIPVVLLSARLSAESVRHLLKETSAQSILLSKRTERLIAQDVADLVEVEIAVPYSLFLESSLESSVVLDLSGQQHLAVDEKDTNVLILHSSGTTGMPKPIRLAHRYILGYAACHRFDAHESVDWPNLSTLPLYHGFGLLAPCLSLSLGMCCIFPPSSVIPAAHSTMELLSTFDARSLMTVPSILEDMICLPSAERSHALSLMRPMQFVAVGGGPLNPEVGVALASDGISILNHYGATEIGAIAPIFRPGPDYDHRYLRLRTDLGLHLDPVAKAGDEPRRFKLIGHPFGWDREFEIQDELVMRPDSQHVEVKILGRRDDLIVLKNGEKVMPQLLEHTLSKDSAIKTAVCIGQGFFEIAMLVEPSNSAPTDKEIFTEHVWGLVSQLNPSLDRHARVSSKRAIIIKPPGKAIPRSDKGSIMRRETQTVFAEQINAAYEALELEFFGTAVAFDTRQLESNIRKLMEMLATKKMTIDSSRNATDDLFELGMDSLQAARLARCLNASIEKTCPGVLAGERLTPAFIYRNPSFAKLTEAVGTIIRGERETAEQTLDRATQMQALADEYVEALDEKLDVQNQSRDAIFLLTGSTGNLGAHILECLVRSSRVAQVICLNRHIPGASDDLRSRQEQANSNAGVVLVPSGWDKVSFLAVNMQTPNLGLTPEQLAQIITTVTHIVHLAWPMDFNRQLTSFRPQINALKTLIHVARSAHRARPHIQPRIMLASSISVVRHYPERVGSSVVPETPFDDPLVTTAMGYAEAKWVCERMMQYVCEKWPRECTPMTVRIGQLSGPERMKGIWKTEEHVPALIRASQMVSAFPDLKGDFSWLPVDRAARALMDVLFCAEPGVGLVYHLENPVRQPLSGLGAVVADELRLKDKCISYEAWLERVAATGYASSLVAFFRDDFRALANGNVSLDTQTARSASAHLRGSGGIDKELVVEYIRRWKRTGFLA